MLIVFLFIIPSFFVSALVSAAGTGENVKSLFEGWSFPWYQILLAIIGALILFFYYEKNESSSDEKPVKLAAASDAIWKRLVVFPVVFTFGMLFAVSLFCRFISEVTGLFDGEILVTKPAGFLQWSFCLINFLCAAFYEEVLYRFYFTDKLYDLIRKKLRWQWFIWICEAAGLAVFAFAHLYMGWISVLNAALAHVFLRLCYKKNGHLWPCVAAHFLYNVISLILL